MSLSNVKYPITNKKSKIKQVWTIGHSTRSFDEFIAMLNSFQIELVADIRNFPGSRKFPQFNKDELEVALPQNNMQYIHLKNLGGRRKTNANSENTVWRHPAFRGYADYMETETFNDGIKKLQEIASMQNTAYMCSEAVWWSCHRSMVSDFLKAKGWKVMHIMGINKAEEHPYTQPARIIDGTLSYKTE
ncbi:DUF488 domain-containing protein [Draconibacterium sp.]